MKKLLVMTIICAGLFTSCTKEDLAAPVQTTTTATTSATTSNNTYQIRIESIGTNDSITYSPIVVVR